MGVVKKEDVVQDSEYLETLIVAVPKQVSVLNQLSGHRLTVSVCYSNLLRDWHDKYERLTAMVVPRSSSYVAPDDFGMPVT